MVGDAAKQGVIKAALGRAQFQVRLAVDGADGLRELIQRGCVDQMHRKSQCDAQHDRDGSGRIAPRVMAQLLP